MLGKIWDWIRSSKSYILWVIILLIVVVPWVVIYFFYWKKGLRLSIQEKPVLTGKPEIQIVSVERKMVPATENVEAIEDAVSSARAILQRLK